MYPTWIAGEAISATINSSVSACRAGSTHDICASASLLAPSMWLKSILSSSYCVITPLSYTNSGTSAFGYFFALFITALAHRDLYDNIWKETIYTVAWLESGVDGTIARIDKDLEKAKRGKDWDTQSADDVDPYGVYAEDIETASARVRRFLSAKPRDEPAPWAKQVPVKRGVDRPFSRNPTPAATPAPGMNKGLPPTPLNITSPKSNTSSRFIEKFRESKMLSRFELPSLYGNHFMSSSNTNGAPPPFEMPTSPNRDLDQPITRPPTSQWVRAEDIKR